MNTQQIMPFHMYELISYNTQCLISHIVPKLTPEHTGDKETGIYDSCNGVFFHKSEDLNEKIISQV